MTLSSSRIRAVAMAIGLTYGAYSIGGVILLFVGFILGTLGVNIAGRPAVRIVMGIVLLQGVTFGGIAIIYLKIRDLGTEFVPFSIPSKRDLILVVLGTIALLGLLFASSSIIAGLGLESAENQVISVGEQSPWVFLLLIPLSFLLVGPGEELLFRGIIQGILREKVHPVRAIILASALFASIHFFSLTGNGKVVYVSIAFVLALVLGAAYDYSNNLLVPSLISRRVQCSPICGCVYSRYNLALRAFVDRNRKTNRIF